MKNFMIDERSFIFTFLRYNSKKNEYNNDENDNYDINTINHN
jgi:hypothetical protein